MTGSHIRKVGEEWKYPNHQELLETCGLLLILTCLEKKRGILRNYLERCRRDLLKEAEKCGKHCLDVYKVLWTKMSIKK